MPISVSSQNVAFSWPPSERGRFYLIQPQESGLTGDPPFTHVPGTPKCAWPSLKAAIANDVANPWAGPVVFVVPELTIHPSSVEELRRLWATVPSNRLLVAGMGHLTSAQCDDLEAGSGSALALWERPAQPDLFANAALVLPGPFLEAKNSPSKWERDRACHRAHTRLRVFNGNGFCFAVLICSDMNDEGARNDLLHQLNPYSLDAIFWLQHNPSPRHDDFLPLLEGLLDRHSSAIIVCANKAPKRGRRDYGASGFVLRADRLEQDKRWLARPNLAIEGLSASVARAVLPQYSAALHSIDTIRPAGIAPAGSEGERNRLLEVVVPYDLVENTLRSRRDGQHIIDLIEQGLPSAISRSRLGKQVRASIEARRITVVQNFAQAANALILFLDHAFGRNQPARHHDSFQSHTPAAACRCWEHRQDFDLLFGQEKSVAVSELSLALAAMEDAEAAFSRRANTSIRISGSKRELLLASGEDKTSERFENEYWGTARSDFIPRPAVVLDCRPRLLAGVNASRPAPAKRDAANALGPELPRLYGDQFWQSCRNGSLKKKLEELFK
jgi:hypothetical protein